MQAHSRFGRGYQILWYGRLRLLLVILLESGWNHHSPHQPQMHATEVPLGIRYLRAQYTPYTTTCSLQLITVSKGSDSRRYRALGTGHVGYPPPKISFIELWRNISLPHPALSSHEVLVSLYIPLLDKACCTCTRPSMHSWNYWHPPESSCASGRIPYLNVHLESPPLSPLVPYIHLDGLLKETHHYAHVQLKRIIPPSRCQDKILSSNL